MEPTRTELLLASLVFLGLPLLVEAGLRISGTPFEPQLYEPNRDRGWTLRADAGGVVSAENRQAVRINSHGFRDRERNYEKPEGAFRVAVLGNSWTEALQVPLEKTYAAVLEKELAKSACFAERRVEVLNFGVAGYSTAQELLTLQQEVWKYQPDLVLLAFYPARDVANNVRALNNAANPEQSPYFVYRGSEIIEDAAFRDLPALQPWQMAFQEWRYGLNDHVKVLQAVATLERRARLRWATAEGKARAEKLGIANLEYNIYRPPTTSEMQEAWQITEALLVLMRDETKARGAEFRIVVLATRPQVLPDPAERVALAVKLGVQDLSYADRRIQGFAAKENIPVTVLAPALASYAETHHVYLNGFNDHNWGTGHWNVTGHRLAAEALAADLCVEWTAAAKAGQK